MAEIPGPQVIDPVELPRESPAQAGRPGEVIADMGQSIDQTLEMQFRIQEAQKHVDTISAENEADAVIIQMHDQLAKTTNSRDVDAVKNQTLENLNQIPQQWSQAKSPAVMEIERSVNSLLPQVEHFSTVRQSDLLVKENDAQTTIQVEKLLPQLVSAHRSGDAAQEKTINDQINGLYDAAISKGLVTTAQKQIAMDAVQEAFRKEVNEAAITSPNPQERLQAIKQLSKGGEGPLDLTNLAPGDVNALRVHAQETNERLNNLSEATNLNAKLNTVDNAFQAPEFKNNFEAQQKALEDPEWLTQHGIVAEDGSPDRVMAEKLSAEVERQRSARNQEQQDNDEKIVEKYSPLIDENKMSRAQIDAIPDEAHGGISNRARSLMIRQWTENYRINRQMALQDRQEAEQEKRSRSTDATGTYMMDILAGKMPDLVQIRTDPNLTPTDRAQVSAALMASQKQDPNFQAGMAILNDAFPRPAKPKTADQQNQYDAQDQQALKLQAETYTEWMQRINANPSENKMEALKDVAKSTTQKDIADRLNQIFNPAPEKPSFWTRIGDAMSPGRTPDKTAPISAPPTGDRIRVREKSSGRIGTIPSDEYDDKKYDKVQ